MDTFEKKNPTFKLIPEFYSEEEAESLCELAISSYINQKIPFDRNF